MSTFRIRGLSPIGLTSVSHWLKSANVTVLIFLSLVLLLEEDIPQLTAKGEKSVNTVRDGVRNSASNNAQPHPRLAHITYRRVVQRATRQFL